MDPTETGIPVRIRNTELLLRKALSLCDKWGRERGSGIGKSVRKWDPRVEDAYKSARELVSSAQQSIMLVLALQQKYNSLARVLIPG